MNKLHVLSAAAMLAVGVIGCENHTYDNDVDRTDRTTSTRVDSATITNDRMNTGNPNNRIGTPSGGTSTGGTITNDNAGIDRNGTGTNIGTGTGTNSNIGTGTGTATGTGTGTGTSGSGTGTGTGSGTGAGRGAGGAGGGRSNREFWGSGLRHLERRPRVAGTRETI